MVHPVIWSKLSCEPTSKLQMEKAWLSMPFLYAGELPSSDLSKTTISMTKTDMSSGKNTTQKEHTELYRLFNILICLQMYWTSAVFSSAFPIFWAFRTKPSILITKAPRRPKAASVLTMAMAMAAMNWCFWAPRAAQKPQNQRQEIGEVHLLNHGDTKAFAFDHLDFLISKWI